MKKLAVKKTLLENIKVSQDLIRVLEMGLMNTKDSEFTKHLSKLLENEKEVLKGLKK